MIDGLLAEVEAAAALIMRAYSPTKVIPMRRLRNRGRHD